MVRLCSLGLVLSLLLLSGCGGDPPPPQGSAPELATKAAAPQAGPEEEWGRTLVSLLRQHGTRGGYLLENLKLAVRREPERSRRGLLTVLQRQLPDWDYAFSLLELVAKPQDGELAETLARVFRQQGYSGSIPASADLLARIESYDLAPEVLAYLKTKRPRFDSADFRGCSRMLRLGNPPGTREFLHSLFAQTPLATGESLGPMAEVLGSIDQQGAFPVLDRLLKEEVWDAQGYVGAVRGMGALGTEPAKQALMALVEKIQDLLDNRQAVLARKYGPAMPVALGELARFPGEDVWEFLLLYRFSSLPGLEEEEKRVEAALASAPPDFVRKTAVAWSNQPWRYDKKKYKPTNREERKLAKGDVLLAQNLDPKFRAHQLEKIDKLRGNEVYDGNIAEHLTKLMPYARAGDQEVRKLYQVWAGKTGQARFTSRNIARQMLAEFRDPLLLELLVKDDDYSEVSDWSRVRDWEPVVLPGLSDRFLKKEIKGGLGSGKISDVVFHYLGVEARKDILQKIEGEIRKCLASPRNSLMMYWLSGLRHWKDPAADTILKEVVQSYRGEGISEQGYQSDNGKREKQGMLLLAQSVLSARGDREAFAAVYARKPLLYNCHWTGVPDEFKAFLKQDYGPMTLRWPTLEEVLTKT